MTVKRPSSAKPPSACRLHFSRNLFLAHWFHASRFQRRCDGEQAIEGRTAGGLGGQEFHKSFHLCYLLGRKCPQLREQGLFNVCIRCEFLFSSRGFRSRFALELPTSIVTVQIENPPVLYPIQDPDPIELLAHVMANRGLTRKDLEPCIGRRGRVADIMNRTRPLTLEMIRRFADELKLPAEVLI